MADYIIPFGAPMAHLPDFWNPRNWTVQHLEVFLERRKGPWKSFREVVDQFGHRWMGRTRSRKWWNARERAQWPSKTGSLDACIDHYNFLVGAYRWREAAFLRAHAIRLRPELGRWMR